MFITTPSKNFKPSNDEIERLEAEQAGFESSVIAGPAEWFERSAWWRGAMDLHAVWPRALARKVELEAGRDPLPDIGWKGMLAPDAGIAASCTHFRATYAISKPFGEKKNGELKKPGAIPLGRGTAILKHFRTLEEFADFLDALGHNDALGFGIARVLADAPAEQSIGIVSKDKLNGSGNGVITRTRDAFMHPEGTAIFWGDIDRAKDEAEVPDPLELDTLLRSLLPWWSGIRCFYRPSISAFIHKGDKELSGRTGMRVYAMIDKGVNSEAVMAIIADALWKTGQRPD